MSVFMGTSDELRWVRINGQVADQEIRIGETITAPAQAKGLLEPSRLPMVPSPSARARHWELKTGELELTLSSKQSWHIHTPTAHFETISATASSPLALVTNTQAGQVQCRITASDSQTELSTQQGSIRIHGPEPLRCPPGHRAWAKMAAS